MAVIRDRWFRSGHGEVRLSSYDARWAGPGWGRTAPQREEELWVAFDGGAEPGRHPLEDEDDAVRVANGTDFGLVPSVSTSDFARAMRVSSRIESGEVLVSNCDRALSGSPRSGTKPSGYGREHTPETLDEYGHTTTLRLLTGLPR